MPGVKKVSMAMAPPQMFYDSRPSTFLDSSTTDGGYYDDDEENSSISSETSGALGRRQRSRNYHVYNYETRFFSNITSYHGLVRIYHSKWWAGRIFWSFVIIFSLVFFIIHVSSLLRDYSDKGTTAQVDFIVPQNGMVFPDVTLCNAFPISIKIVEESDEYPPMSENVLSYILTAFLRVENLGNEDIFHKLQNEFFKWHRKYMGQNDGNKFNSYDFFKKNGHPCEKMVEWCTFAGVRITNCCKHAVPVMTDRGLCYRFENFEQRQGVNSYQTISGSFYGLQMLIDLESSTFYHDDSNTTRDVAEDMINSADSGPVTIDKSKRKFKSTGVKFQVSDDRNKPFRMATGTSIPNGKKGFGALSLKKVELLSVDKGGFCVTDWPAGSRIMHSDTNYSTTICETNCVAYAFKDACGCIPLSYYYRQMDLSTNRSTNDVCEPNELYPCNKKLQDGAEEIRWKGNCNCPVQCERTDYDIRLSYSDIPPSLLSPNGDEINDTYTGDNYVSLSIFMNEMYYESNVQRRAVLRGDLLSNVGGSMGLFMGMSIISLMEIFIFIVKTIWGFVWTTRGEDLRQREEGLTDELEEEMMCQEEEEAMEAIRKITTLYNLDPPRLLDTLYGSDELWAHDGSDLTLNARSQLDRNTISSVASALASPVLAHSRKTSAAANRRCARQPSPSLNGVRNRAITFAAAASANKIM